MTYINLIISFFSMLATIAAAVAAYKSATSAKAANSLAKEVLTKRAQYELFSKVLLELAHIHSLMTDFINNEEQSDADFMMTMSGNINIELRALLKKLNALSPKFRESFKEDGSLDDLLKRMSLKNYMPSDDDLVIVYKMIDLLIKSQREELSNP